MSASNKLRLTPDSSRSAYEEYKLTFFPFSSPSLKLAVALFKILFFLSLLTSLRYALLIFQ